MDKNLHNIDQYFREGIEGHTDEPGDLVWKNLDQQLDKEAVVLVKRRYLLTRRTLIAVAALFLFSVFLLVYKYNHNSAEQKVDTDSVVLQKESTSPSVGDKSPAKISSGVRENTNEAQTGHAKNQESEKLSYQIPVTQPERKTSLINRKQEERVNESRNDKLTLPTIKPGSRLTVETKSKEKPGYAKANENKIVMAVDDNAINKLNDHTIKNKFSTGKTDAIDKKDKLFYGNNADGEIQRTSPAISNYVFTQSANADFITGEIVQQQVSPGFTNEEQILPGMHQTEVIPVIKKPKENASWSVAPFYTPEAVVNHVGEGQREQREDDRDAIRDGEKVKWAGNFGLQIKYQLNKNWSLLSGVTVSKTVSTILPKNIYARPERGASQPGSGDMKYKLNCAAGYAYVSSKSAVAPAFGDSIRALESTNTLSYVSIPVGASYSFRKNKLGVYLFGSVNTNILTKGNVEAIVTEQTGTKTQSTVTIQGLKPVYISGVLGLGIEYYFSQRISVFSMPEKSFSFSSINKDTPANTKRGSFGLQTGIRFRL